MEKDQRNYQGDEKINEKTTKETKTTQQPKNKTNGIGNDTYKYGEEIMTVENMDSIFISGRYEELLHQQNELLELELKIKELKGK